MWYELEQGEIRQLNHMHNLWMFEKPIDAPNNEIVLTPQCKYATKRNGLTEIDSDVMDPKEMIPC